MAVLADTHVHLYPEFSLPELLSEASARSRQIAAGAGLSGPSELALFLAERSGQREFQRLSALAQEPFPLNSPQTLQISTTRSPEVLEVSALGAKAYLIAGRQIISLERLEVLALCSLEEITDGLPAERIIEQILSSGGIPVLPYSPGKWTSSRGQKATELFEKFGARLAVGDISMRPQHAQMPQAMKQALALGSPLLPGSDPLPLRDDQHQIGSYLKYAALSISTTDPACELKSALKEAGLVLGRRNSLARGAWRWARGMLAARLRRPPSPPRAQIQSTQAFR